MYTLHRPVENIILAHADFADETERRRAAIRKATRMTSPRAAACFLCNALGMTQAEIGEVFGIRKQTAGYHIRNFKYYLRVAYRRPDA